MSDDLIPPPNLVDVFLDSDDLPFITVSDVSKGPVVVDVAEGAVAPPAILYGAGAPPETTGNTGQFYVDSVTGIMYGPKLAAATAQPPAVSVTDLATAPTSTVATAASGYEMGMRFRVTGQSVNVTAIRWYRASGDVTTARTVRLWTAAGVSLATKDTTAAQEFGVGWRTVTLTAPVLLAPGDYVVSYGSLPNNNRAFQSPMVIPPAHGPLSWVSNIYAPAVGTFPNTAGATSYYLVDVEATPTSAWPVTDGSGVHSGPSVPPEALGNPGQYYVDTTNGVLYGPKQTAAVALNAAETLVSMTQAPTTQSDVSGGLGYGVVFTPTVSGQITAIRYYRSTGATSAARTLRLWDDLAGTNVGSIVTAEAGWGWMTYPLAAPVNVTAGKDYVVNYQADAQMAYATPFPAPLANTHLITKGARSGASGAVKPTTPVTIFPMIDVVFRPTSLWPVAGVDPIRSARMDAYTVPGTYTWTKPAGARTVVAVVQAAGGGGGSGRRGAAGTARTGGSGGGGGSWVMTQFAAADLPATVTVLVATGGAAGAAVPTDDTDGAVGIGAGGFSSFGAASGTAFVTNWRGQGGAAGQGGKSGAAATGSSGALGTAASLATPAAGGVGPAGVFTVFAATSGSGGGGLSTANAAANGGVNYISPYSQGYTTTLGGVGGTTGTDGATNTWLPTTVEPWPPGTGGAGGGTGNGGAGGKGGDGTRGGGGGGGGASANGFASGAGGRGGDGFVQVITYF